MEFFVCTIFQTENQISLLAAILSGLGSRVGTAESAQQGV
jgi:hypothetical protein